jgi:hypothetical protein
MKRGTPRHPKTYALAKILGVPLYSAVGILEMLWHHANQHTPRGDIGSLPDEAIAESVSWTKKPSILMDALLASRWLDADEEHRLIIHDWPDHCEQSSIKWLEYNHTNFLPVYGVSLEKRKRNSSNSPAPREAMAMAMELELEKASEKTSKKEKTSTREEERFSEFWAIFWRKVAPAAAKKAYSRHVFSEELHSAVILAIKQQSGAELAKEPQFRPHAATWLNQHRWENEPDPVPVNGNHARNESQLERLFREMKEESNA